MIVISNESSVLRMCFVFPMSSIQPLNYVLWAIGINERVRQISHTSACAGKFHSMIHIVYINVAQSWIFADKRCMEK